MSNYKWITYFKEGKQRSFLVDENFKKFSFPIFKEIDYLLKTKLLEHGIGIEVVYTEDWEAYFKLIPLEKEYAMITAPVYQIQEGSYSKVNEEYTGKVVHPKQYEWIREEIKKCRREVREEQANKFLELFNKNTLDGLTACIQINSLHTRGENEFYSEKYVPNGYIQVCCKNYRMDNKARAIVFMKKRNWYGAKIQIRLPKGYKELAIGKEAKNIRKIERLVNASQIIVI